jgi:hypothetical protein
VFHPRYDRRYNKRNEEATEQTIKTFFVKPAIMPVEFSTTVRVAYYVVIDANDNGRIDWIKTQERMERFVESYGNEDVEVNRSAKRVCTVPPSNLLFALAAQAVATDNEDLQAALTNATKEDVERIRELYPILVTASYDPEEEDFTPYPLPRAVLLKKTTSKVLDKILGRDDHGLEFTFIGHSHEYVVGSWLVLSHEIRFKKSWNERFHGVKFNVVPLSLPSVEPTVGFSMAHVLSVLGMKAVDEPGWKVVCDHCHELF